MGLRADRWFRRFQATGDARALAVVFDRTAPELMRVALHLTRDPHRAEDALQSTFLTAIEKAHEYDPARRVVPWLLAILANHLRQQNRAERRGGAPVTAEATGGDVGDVVAGRELLARCDAVLDALPEPYRHVLILHLRHDLGAAEIARAHGRSASTVRNQIARGLDRLRRRLPAGLAPGLAVLVPDGARLAALRARVLARAPQPMAVASAGLTAGIGVMMMSKKLLVGAALALAVGAGAWAGGWFSADAAIDPTAAERAPARVAMGPDTPAAAARDVSATPQPRREPIPTPTPVAAPTGAVRVEVLRDGRAARGLPFWITVAREDLDGAVVAQGWTPEHTPFTVADLAPGDYVCELPSCGERRPFSARAGAVEEIRIEIGGGWQIRGRVVDASGGPVAAEVRAMANGNRSYCLARSGADGTFTAEGLRGNLHLWARASGRTPSRRHALPERSGTADVRLVTGGAGSAARLAGRVVGEDGQGVAHARVWLGVDKGAESPFVQRELHDLVADGSGVFAADWLPPGGLFVGAMPADGERSRASARWVTLHPHAQQRVTLQLGEGATLRGVVRRPDGTPVGGARVGAWMHGETGLGPFSQPSTTSDQDGRYALAGLLPRRHGVSAQRGGLSTDTEVEPQPGQELRWDPVLEAGSTLEVELRGPAGAPLSGWRIELRRADPSGNSQHQSTGATDAGGWCAFRDLPPVPHEVRVLVDDVAVSAAVRQGIVPGEPVHIQLDALPAARLRGRVVDGNARPVTTAKVTLMQAGAPFVRPLRLDREGRFDSGRLPAGSFSVSATAQQEGLASSFHHSELGADEVRDLGDVVLAATGSLLIRVRGAGGAPPRGAVVRVGHPGDVNPGAENLQPDEIDGSYRVDGLDPGPYVVRFLAEDAVPCQVPVTLAPGEERAIEIVADTAVPITLELRCKAPAEGANDMLNGVLTIHDGDGERIVFHRLWPYFDDPEQRIERLRLALPPGTYRVHAMEFGGGENEVEIEVAREGAAQAFVIDLR